MEAVKKIVQHERQTCQSLCKRNTKKNSTGNQDLLTGTAASIVMNI